jgi:hypothetical protein
VSKLGFQGGGGVGRTSVDNNPRGGRGGEATAVRPRVAGRAGGAAQRRARKKHVMGEEHDAHRRREKGSHPPPIL